MAPPRIDATTTRIGIVRDRLRTITSVAVWNHLRSTRRLHRHHAQSSSTFFFSSFFSFGDYVRWHRTRPSPTFDIGCRMVPPVIDECIGIMHNRPRCFCFLSATTCIGIVHGRPRAITSVAVWNHLTTVRVPREYRESTAGVPREYRESTERVPSDSNNGNHLSAGRTPPVWFDPTPPTLTTRMRAMRQRRATKRRGSTTA